jgi:hypothetical protein
VFSDYGNRSAVENTESPSEAESGRVSHKKNRVR